MQVWTKAVPCLHENGNMVSALIALALPGKWRFPVNCGGDDSDRHFGLASAR
jgi:hypothetical protein